jgi:hypothetical protein
LNADDGHGEEGPDHGRRGHGGSHAGKQQQRPRLPEMEVLLHGVRVDLARRPAGEPLLRCSLSKG